MGSGALRAGSVVAYAVAAVLAIACEPPSYYGDDYYSGASRRADAHNETAESSPPARPTAGEDGVGTDTRDAGSGMATTPSSRVDASVSVTPATQTFTVGVNDCSGGHCNGGYDGQKDIKLLPTATEQCVDRGFGRATDFTIGGQPGGRFCTFTGGTYGCDSSCDGCNVMTTITCVKP
jgi:hypothetical protein